VVVTFFLGADGTHLVIVIFVPELREPSPFLPPCFFMTVVYCFPANRYVIILPVANFCW